MKSLFHRLRNSLLHSRALSWLEIWIENITVRYFLSARKPYINFSMQILGLMTGGSLLLAIPLLNHGSIPFIDHIFTAVSAVSTTGLTTVNVGDQYNIIGQIVILFLFQIGAIGYMSVASYISLSGARTIRQDRLLVLKASVPIPASFNYIDIVKNSIRYTIAVEILGAALLYHFFSDFGVPHALWYAIFHTVSAFATAGFALDSASLEAFQASYGINLTISGLAYLGGIGFIVIQDFFYRFRKKGHTITFTTHAILVLSVLTIALGTTLFFLLDQSTQELPLSTRILTAFFTVVSASSTAGFSTVNIGAISSASVILVMILMIIGSSPSGTGGGVKTTTILAVFSIVNSILRGRDRVILFHKEIPQNRLLQATTTVLVYLFILVCGVFILSISEQLDLVPLVFEAASALGTVGLSMGITSELSTFGKMIVIALMYMGRIGAMTVGLILFLRRKVNENATVEDIISG